MIDILKPNWSIDINSYNFDLSITALGYESRASYLAQKSKNECKNSNKLAISFDLNKELAYKYNLNEFKKLGYIIEELPEESLSDFLDEFLAEALPSDEIKYVLVDISSFSRSRLAIILEKLFKYLAYGSEIVFGYSVAHYNEPTSSTTPITKVSPLSSYFAGEPSSPSNYLTCLMGLGYEEDRAIGAIEFLEVGDTIIFKPISLDIRFDKTVNKANKVLLNEIPKNKIIEYEMNAPSRIYSILDATVKGLLKETRLIVIPMGPKVFTLISLLVSINNRPNLPIWSVSSINDKPIDRRPSGKCICFSVVKIDLHGDIKTN